MQPPQVHKHPLLRSLRTIAGFTLLGTVLAGSVLGWTEYGDTARWVGAGIGLATGTTMKMRHLI